MQRYIEQLLEDIAFAVQRINDEYAHLHPHLRDWVSEEEEDALAQVHPLEEWTGIRQEQLPPATLLTDEQVAVLLKALHQLLDACNWAAVLQTLVPPRTEYTAMRAAWPQAIRVKRWHMGFFDWCLPDTLHGACALGEHCQCAFYESLREQFTDEPLSPEEERRRMLEIEIRHIQRKYGDDWMKHYPYHLDPEYDDEYGNPYDYGMGGEDDDDDDRW